MLDSFPVQHYFSTPRKHALRVLIVLAFGGILFFNFVTTCTPNFSATFDNGCNKAVIPAGTQLFYSMYSMSTKSQIEYDGFDITGCQLKDVMIQEWFVTTQAPIFKIKMDMFCDRGVNFAVTDININFWHTHYSAISVDAQAYRNFQGGPYEAMEFKWGWNNSDPTLDNNIRFFTKESVNIFNGNDPGIKKTFFVATMQFALDDVQGKKIPGVLYLCSRCANKADWLTQKVSLVWKLFYNTLNTSTSIYAGIIFALALMERNKFIEIYEDIINEKTKA